MHRIKSNIENVELFYFINAQDVIELLRNAV